MKHHFESKGDTETEQLAEDMGSRLRGSEVIELVSDVGGGKTTFVRGLARGVKSKDKVASPTFTISRQYQGESVRIYHYDFYRIDDAETIRHEFDEQSDDTDGVRVIEWAGVIEDVLPEKRIKVLILCTGPDTRNITVTVPREFRYVMEQTA